MFNQVQIRDLARRLDNVTTYINKLIQQEKDQQLTMKIKRQYHLHLNNPSYIQHYYQLKKINQLIS